MLIFGQNTEEGFGKITKSTKKFLVGIFGFFPYEREEDVNNFLTKELKLKIETGDLTKTAKNLAIEVYQASGGGTADVGYILTPEFKSKKEAQNFIDTKIQNSEYVNKRLFCDIEVIDAEAFYKLVDDDNKARVSEELSQQVFNKKLKTFLTDLKTEFKTDKGVVDLANKYLRNIEK